MTPIRICTRISAETTQKYFSVARCDAVAVHEPSGSVAGSSAGASSAFCDAYHHTMAQMPASSMMMLTPVHSTLSPVGRLPISGSNGQLCVYDTWSPTRFVAADHDVQKINAANWRMRSGLLIVPEGMA